MVKIKGKSPAGAARLPGGLAAAMGSKRQILTTSCLLIILRDARSAGPQDEDPGDARFRAPLKELGDVQALGVSPSGSICAG